jgi:hypothetical protein
VFSTKTTNHVSLQGKYGADTAQWQHPIASSEALDVLYWVMHPALHRRSPMVIKTASYFPAFFALSILLSPTTVANNHFTVIII